MHVQSWMAPRFLQCRSSITVGVLKKFIRLKFDLAPDTPVSPTNNWFTSGSHVTLFSFSDHENVIFCRFESCSRLHLFSVADDDGAIIIDC